MVIETRKGLLEARMLDVRDPIFKTKLFDNVTNGWQMFMVDIREQMVFYLEIESSWEVEHPVRMDRMVGGCQDLVNVPVSTGWVGWVFMDVGQLGVHHK